MGSEDIVRDVNSLTGFVKRTRALVAAKHAKLGLEPRVLTHFNEWADGTIAQMFAREGIKLQPAKVARYDPDRNGFEIELGELYVGPERLSGDFFDENIHAAIQGYQNQTPWVYRVETRFDFPK